jgi:hypothetical protein
VSEECYTYVGLKVICKKEKTVRKADVGIKVEVEE